MTFLWNEDYFTTNAGTFAPQLHTSAGAVKLVPSDPPDVDPAVVAFWNVMSPALPPEVIVAQVELQFVVSTT